MRYFILVVGCLAVLSLTTNVEAAVEPSVKDTYDSGCAADMTTDACFGDPEPMTLNGPTVTKCRATRQNNQACRSCEPKYLDNGQYAGYKVCAYVPWNASCGCTFKNGPCQNEQSWCDYYV